MADTLTICCCMNRWQGSAVPTARLSSSVTGRCLAKCSMWPLTKSAKVWPSSTRVATAVNLGSRPSDRYPEHTGGAAESPMSPVHDLLEQWRFGAVYGCSSSVVNSFTPARCAAVAGYAVATRIGTVTASPREVAAPCRHFRHCGGCTLQNLAYAAQLDVKQTAVRAIRTPKQNPDIWSRRFVVLPFVKQKNSLYKILYACGVKHPGIPNSACCKAWHAVLDQLPVAVRQVSSAKSTRCAGAAGDATVQIIPLQMRHRRSSAACVASGALMTLRIWCGPSSAARRPSVTGTSSRCGAVNPQANHVPPQPRSHR